MTLILQAYSSATLPAHNAGQADINSPAGMAHSMSTFSNGNNTAENGQTNASSRIQVVSVNGEPWMRFTHATDYIRNEVADTDTSPGIAEGTTCWHAISFIIRQGGLVAGGGAKLANLTQVHQSFPPPVGIYIDRGGSSGAPYRLRYAMKPGGGDKTITTWSTLPYNERIDVIFKVRYHHSTGTMSCFWRRSSTTDDYSGAWQSPNETMGTGASMNSGDGLYFKQGIYRPDTPGDGSTWIVDHKGFYVSQLDGSTTDSEARAEVEALYGTTNEEPTPDPPPDSNRIGVDLAGASFNATGADRGRGSAWAVAPPEDGTLTHAVMYLDGNGGGAGSQQYRYVVYRNGTKIAETATQTMSAGATGGWYKHALTSNVDVVNGDTIIISLHTGTTANVIRYAYDAETDALYFYTDTFSDGSAGSLPTTSPDAKRISAYAVWTTDPSGGGGGGSGQRTYRVGGRLYVAGRRLFQATGGQL